MRSMHSLLIVLLLVVLGGCALPSPEETAGTTAPSAEKAAVDGTNAGDPAAVPDAQDPASARNPSEPETKRMRTGGPLPPERIAAPGGAPVEVDYGCRSDADCAVKNVGNCCGYYPACVNKDSPTDPEGVMARCDKEGMASVCGFPEIAACTCQRGRCEAKVAEALR